MTSTFHPAAGPHDNKARGRCDPTRLAALICATLLVVLCPSWARDQEDRFIEFPGDVDTTTYDLSTAQLIQPGRFTIISTTIDDADVMNLELQVLGVLRTYCGRPDGKYPVPDDVFTLGPPDMPIKSIDVISNFTDKANPFKRVLWSYPYKRLEKHLAFLTCRQWSRTEDELFWEHRSLITNGNQAKYLFDCRRGLMGLVLAGSDLAKITTFPVQGGFLRDYLSICYHLMHEQPYLPK